MNLKRHSALITIMSVMFMPAANSQQALESLQLQPGVTIHGELESPSEQVAPLIVVPAKPALSLPSQNNKQHVKHCSTIHSKLHAVGMGLKVFMKVLLPVAQLAGAAATIVFTVHQFR